MFVTRQNLKGGPHLKSCPIDVDDSGHVGYKIGYCAGCNESLLIGMAELYEVLESFGMLDKTKKASIREKIIQMLGGTILDK